MLLTTIQCTGICVPRGCQQPTAVEYFVHCNPVFANRCMKAAMEPRLTGLPGWYTTLPLDVDPTVIFWSANHVIDL